MNFKHFKQEKNWFYTGMCWLAGWEAVEFVDPVPATKLALPSKLVVRVYGKQALNCLIWRKS